MLGTGKIQFFEVPALSHNAGLNVGLDFMQHFHEWEVFPKRKITNVHFVNAQNVQISENLHEVIDVGFVALEGLVADNFGAEKFAHFEGIGRIEEVNFEEGLFFGVVTVKVHFVLDFSFVDEGFVGVVGLLGEGFEHVEEVDLVEGVREKVGVFVKLDVKGGEEAVNVGTAFLAEFIGAIDASHRGKVYFLSSEVKTVFVKG